MRDPPPLNFTFKWEGHKGMRKYVKSHHCQALHSLAKINKSIREYKGPTPVTLYIQLGKLTKTFGNIKAPPPLNFTFDWEDQQRK